MRRILIVVAYDGTNYCGWQIQKNGETVEGVLSREIGRFLGEDTSLIGASRTDAGVHALGNVAVFDTESRIPADKFAFALNKSLPSDIRIQASMEVPSDFHPRHTSCIKTYEYRILNRNIEDPGKRLNSYFYRGRLDADLMRRAYPYLIGEHDFRSFCSTHTSAETTVRTVYSISLLKEGDILRLRITGNGFLYNMVRIIAGTLIQAGAGMIKPEDMVSILRARDRSAAGPTAPARGLTLVGMEFPEYPDLITFPDNN